MAASEHVNLDFFDYVNDLKQLPRTGWLLAGVPAPESIAAHTFSTLFFALLLTHEINADLDHNALSEPLDRERVLVLGMIHDVAESLVTDLPKRSSELLGRTTKHEAERNAIRHLSVYLPESFQLQKLWKEYEDGKSAEARVVHDADKLEMAHQAGRYERAGHRNLHEFWQGHTFHFAASQHLYDALVARREARDKW